MDRIKRAIFHGLRGMRLALLGTVSLLMLSNANAIPLFANQTGAQCVACHAGGQYPELTAFGRKFKQLGYSLGKNTIPISAMVVGGYSALSNQNGSADPATDFAHDREAQLLAISLFTGGKIVDNLGAFVQWNYDAVEHHSALDNTDIRYGNSTKLFGADAMYGFTLNNNPSMQDLYNSTPAWGFPYLAPGGAFQGFGAQPVVMGGLAHQIAGLGAYIDWNDTLYAEIAGYKTADGLLAPFRMGTYNSDPTSGGAGPYAISGTSPYWRLAYHGAKEGHEWMLGAYGFNAKQYTDSYDAASPLIHYNDVALDAQYQYTKGDMHYFTTAAWIRERISPDASLVGTGSGFDNATNTLHWKQLKFGATYKSKYSGNVMLFDSSGSTDTQLYEANTNPRPDTRGTLLELSYLPHPQVKLGLQYVMYSRFNGSSNNYDNSGTFTLRNAHDNNTLGFFIWAAF